MICKSLTRVLAVLVVLFSAGCSDGPKEPVPEQAAKAGQPATVEQRAHHLAVTIRADAGSRMPPVATGSQTRLPLDQAIAQQLQAARDGNIQIGRMLGERLLSCRRSLRTTPLETLLERYERDMADIGSDNPAISEVRRMNTENHFLVHAPDLADGRIVRAISEVRRMNTENHFLVSLDTYEDCKHAKQVPMAEAVQWLKTAGMAGDAQAQLAYARYALEEFPDLGALIRNPAAAKERADLARTWTERLVEAGNERALEFMTEALSGNGPLYAGDREQAYIYGHVLNLIRAKRSDRSPYAKPKSEFNRLWNSADVQYDRQLTPAQVENINRRAREIYLAHFAAASP